MIDLALLRVLKYREQFDKVARYIPKDAMSKKTNAIVKDIGKYFDSTEEQKLDFSTFRSLFFTAYHKNLKEEDVKFYNKLITQMEEDVPEAVQKNMVNALLELKMATSVANLIDEYQAGEEIAIVDAVFGVAQQTKEALERTTNFEKSGFDDSSVEEGLSDDVGYKWCLPMLNKTYRRIQGGDATIIAARPGKGKTTFLCQTNVAMAEDMPAHKTIVWLNNESRRQKIMSRQIQSAVGKTDKELHQMMKEGTLKDAYIKVMGSANRVEIYDIHGKNHTYIEEILETYGEDGVGAIVFDMLDKVKMPMPQGMREDQRLEELYTWGRELGVFYNCPTFPTSQISVEGAGMLFPAEHMLKDSKTGKQGACDNILMLGSSEDPMIQNTRGISMAKEKIKRAGEEHLQGEVLFDADIGRYIEG
jgi:replicative DNA helicase